MAEFTINVSRMIQKRRSLSIVAIGCLSSLFISVDSFSSSSLNSFAVSKNSFAASAKKSSSSSIALFSNDDNNNNKSINHDNGLLSQISKSFSTASLILALTFFSPVDNINNHINTIANAAGYGSFTEEQKFVAEAWRIVDNTYLDRTFNNQDWFQIRENAVKKKYKNLGEAQSTVEGILGSLGDKYTRYLPPEKYMSLVNSATGTLAGVGVQISPTNDDSQRIMALDVEEVSPANNAGIQPGDIFIEVDGQNVEKSTPDEIASLLRGQIGSKVGVVMQRSGKNTDYILKRDQIKVTSVKSYMSGKSKDVGVIRIKSFSGTTADAVTEELQALKKKGAKSFIIDLRGNPGGLLPGGVNTASLFLEQNKPVVFVVNKSGIVDAQSTYQDGIDLEDPLVLFVNDQTASASEVMTAALQENNRAVIVGDGVDHTFGKGIVQTIRELSNNNGGVAVTIARYETPKHNDINKQGIKVDVTLDKMCDSQDVGTCVPSSAFQKN